jgi:predicted MPP superfamily phosphohydrolase
MSMTDLEKISRRTFLKKGWKVGLSVLGMAAIGDLYIMGERFRYQTRQFELTIRNLPEAFKGWKIVQFSDVHFGFHYGAKHFHRVVKMINNLKPDILFFTGDLLDRSWKEQTSFVPLLQALNAPRGGKWAVLGNHDYTFRDRAIQLLQDSEFRVLINSHGYIDNNQKRLYIAGVDDFLFGKYDIKKTLQGLSDYDCVLLLAHEPDTADISCKLGVNAQFSGHSHGGQIRLPFMKPFFTPELAQIYIEGLYTVGERKMPLYVNRGIGTSNLPLRLFCRPEITVFHLT